MRTKMLSDPAAGAIKHPYVVIRNGCQLPTNLQFVVTKLEKLSIALIWKVWHLDAT